MGKLLTITIPVYNTEQYLPRCIESLIVPRYLDKIEILVIIDGSPDNSLAVAQRYETMYPHTIIVVDKPNGGHGSTINKGIELATGKYFRVLDSDDWFDTFEFEKYLDMLDSLDVDMALSNYSREEVFRGKSIPFTYHNIEYNQIYDAETFDYTHFIGDKLIVLAAVTYKTSLLKNNKIRLFERMFYVDVQYSLFIFPFIKKFVFIDRNVYKYFIGREGQSTLKVSFRRNYSQHLNVVKSCIDYYIKNGKSLSENRKYFFEREILDKVIRQYNIVIFILPFRQSLRELRAWDNYLRENDSVYYVLSNRTLNVYLYRKLGMLAYPIYFSIRWKERIVNKLKSLRN